MMGPLEALFAWARSSSMAAIPFIGTVESPAAAEFLDWARAAALGRAPGAATPGQADLLVVVGRISHKAAPVLMRTHAAMAHPALVLHLPLTGKRAPAEVDAAHDPTAALLDEASYATVDDLEEVLPVDVVIRGAPPSAAAIQKGLALLAERGRRREAS